MLTYKAQSFWDLPCACFVALNAAAMAFECEVALLPIRSKIEPCGCLLLYVFPRLFKFDGVIPLGWNCPAWVYLYSVYHSIHYLIADEHHW